MFGATGNDRLTGGADADTLAGGGGRDRFVYLSPSDSRARTADTITDFRSGDRIDVSAIDAGPKTKGEQAFQFGTTAAHTGDIVAAFDAAANVTAISLFINAHSNPDLAINLTGNIPLPAADFVL